MFLFVASKSVERCRFKKKKKKNQTNTVIVKFDILKREIKRGTTLLLAQKSSYLCRLFITNAQTNEQPEQSSDCITASQQNSERRASLTSTNLAYMR